VFGFGSGVEVEVQAGGCSDGIYDNELATGSTWSCFRAHCWQAEAKLCCVVLCCAGEFVRKGSMLAWQLLLSSWLATIIESRLDYHWHWIGLSPACASHAPTTHPNQSCRTVV
jgi:hypothetical protein